MLIVADPRENHCHRRHIDAHRVCGELLCLFEILSRVRLITQLYLLVVRHRRRVCPLTEIPAESTQRRAARETKNSTSSRKCEIDTDVPRNAIRTDPISSGSALCTDWYFAL